MSHSPDDSEPFLSTTEEEDPGGRPDDEEAELSKTKEDPPSDDEPEPDQSDEEASDILDWGDSDEDIIMEIDY